MSRSIINSQMKAPLFSNITVGIIRIENRQKCELRTHQEKRKTVNTCLRKCNIYFAKKLVELLSDSLLIIVFTKRAIFIIQRKNAQGKIFKRYYLLIQLKTEIHRIN